jgi:hypothetical protein
MLELMRQNGTGSFAWRAGGVPRLNFALDPTYDANGFGNYGVLKFAGEWDHGEPIMHFERVGTEAMLLNSFAEANDRNPRLILYASGNINWGSGTTPVDTDLYRSTDATLRTDGSFSIGGNLMVTGSKSAVIQTSSYGKREVFAVESPGEWLEDFGSARLVKGRSFVKIERVFGETVMSGGEYHVFLTPNDRCSLYIERKRADGFTVRALQGSKSCSFDYRIAAKRRGYANVRLTKIGND